MRRSRTDDSDDEDADVSRESTPISSAVNDRKRMRPSHEPDNATPGPSSRKNAQQSRNVVPGSTLPDRKFVLHPKRTHQPGAIVRVKLTDFVTYTSAEFHPGPNLNMVIGPNGTGKSTLVCAICIGLGWNPDPILGRAKEASEFIKHGCREATIEIELQRATEGTHSTPRNPVIRRTILKKDGKSRFWINDKSCSAKMVRELAQKFNIQIDNLCQFLPQDRVVEFASLKPVQMLETTLEAAAAPDVIEFYDKLKQLRKYQRDQMQDFKGDREHLESEEKRQAMQLPDVEKFRERQALQKRLELLEKCRPIPQYRVLRDETIELRDKQARLAAETTQLQRESEPILRSVNAKQQYAQAAKDRRDRAMREVRNAGGECGRLEREIGHLTTAVEEADNQAQQVKITARKSKIDLSKQQVELTRLKSLKENRPQPFDPRAINEQLQTYSRQLRELTERKEVLANDYRLRAERGKELSDKIKAIEDQLNNMSTEEGQRETRFQEMGRTADTVKAWKWISENKDKFKMEVFGPPALTCTLKDPRWARQMESLIPQGDMKILTVQCREDFELLQQKLNREMRLHDITLRTNAKTDLSSYRQPVNDAEMERLGISHWAIDIIEGPPQVLAMLCSNRSLHQTAFARDDISNEQEELLAKSQINNFFARNKLHSTKRRNDYKGESVTTARDLQEAKIWSNQPIATGRRERLTLEMKGYREERHPLKEICENIKIENVKVTDEVKDIAEAERKLRAEKEAKQKALTEYNNLDTRIDAVQDKIDEYQTRLENVRDEVMAQYAKKDDAMFQKTEVILRYCGAAHVLKEAHAKLIEAEIVSIEAHNDFEVLAQRNMTIKTTLEQKKAELQKVSEEHDATKAKARTLAKVVRALNAEADRLAEEEDDTGLREVVTEITSIEKVSEQHLADLIERDQELLDMRSGGINAANIIREFEDRARRIEKLQAKLAKFNEEQEQLKDSLSEMKQKFEEELEPIITKIDQAFSESFERIGCAGQVQVHKASSEDPADCTEELGGQDNGLEFDKWAIHIYVKFRESEPLKLLDNHRQSGGERAVSTIFYLMALQSLSRSPFRVVDEINQGMDPRNERMVHGRMVDIAAPDEGSDTAGSQYFLITPKLLSGLKYKPGMTVLCIVSGENMPSATDVTRYGENGEEYVEKGCTIDFSAYTRKARSLGYARSSTVGWRVDSGIGLPVQVGA